MFNVVLVYVPQQAQLLLDKSPLDAGVYLIGYSAVAAVAAALVNIFSSRGRIPFIYSLLVGCTLHTVGIGLLSTIAASTGFHATDIVYEAIAGAGLGVTMGILVLAPPYIVEDRDLSIFPFPREASTIGYLANHWRLVSSAAIATGFVVQIRFLGGALGLAIASHILNGRLAHHLQGILSKHELHVFLENVERMKNFTPHLKDEVHRVFAESFTTQMRVMIGFAAAQLPAILLLIKPGQQLAARKQRSDSISKQ